MNLSKSYLQSVSTDELLKIADNYGVFVPNGLSRNLIIEELLEMDEDSDRIDNTLLHDDILSDEDNKNTNMGLVLSYNKTEIHVLLRDPIWAFTFWDFYKPEFLNIKNNTDFESFFLRILLFSQNNLSEAYDYFDIDVSDSDRSRYFYLSFDDSTIRVELCSRAVRGDVTVLARSNFSCLKRENIPKNLCVLEYDLNPIMFLSGLSALKKHHFKHYRQAFRRKEEPKLERL